MPDETDMYLILDLICESIQWLFATPLNRPETGNTDGMAAYCAPRANHPPQLFRTVDQPPGTYG